MSGEPQVERFLGIDLGTTKSGVSAWDAKQGKAVLVPDDSNALITPSLVGWDEEAGDWVVGRRAKSLAVGHPSRVAYSIKRYMGRWFNDPTVTGDRPRLAYTLSPGGGADPLGDILVDFGPGAGGAGPGGQCRLSAPEVSARILAKLRDDAERRFGTPDGGHWKAVVTVPAYFNVLQRRATILAGKLAGLDVVAILNEPTAAALAYNAENPDLLSAKEQRILVYDLGGGTFDVSLLEARRDKIGYEFHTIVVDGNTRLGGDDIDAAMVRRIADEIERQYGQVVRPDDVRTWSRLRWEAEQAKVELQAKSTVTLDLPGLDLGGRSPFDARLELTRGQLEESAGDVIERTKVITRRAVVDVAGFGWDEIDHVILVGGQTRMPAVRRSVAELTGKVPLVSPWPERLVALGAGEYAHILSRGPERFQENTLVNVVALPLGIRLDDDTFKPLVAANATIPHLSPPYHVTTTEHNQTMVRLEVLQGARGVTRASDCVVLGGLDMEVPPAPAGTPKFEVAFDVKTDGTMTVRLTDLRRKRVPEVIDIVTERAWRERPRESVPTPAVSDDAP